MIPTKINSFSTSDYLNKLYDSEGSMTLGCPRSNSNYLTYSTNKESTDTINYVKHTKKYFMLDSFIDKFHVGTHVGQTVINYKYKSTMGYLNEHKQYCFDKSSDEATLETTSDN